MFSFSLLTGLVLGLVAASEVPAQSPAGTDTLSHRLEPVSINAEKHRGVFHRLSDRSMVRYLERENRFLERKLAHLDGVILRLETRLDSLRSAHAMRKQGILMLDSTVAAMRAHRIQMEATMRVRELIATRRGPAEY